MNTQKLQEAMDALGPTEWDLVLAMKDDDGPEVGHLATGAGISPNLVRSLVDIVSEGDMTLQEASGLLEEYARENGGNP